MRIMFRKGYNIFSSKFDLKRVLVTANKTLTSVTNSDIEVFYKLLGVNGVKTEDLDSFNTDWLRSHKGHSNVVLQPDCAQSVSSILKYCSQQNLKCVIQGGNTSLVAGSVPTDDEMIISMNRLNRVESFDENTGILICESGCVLQTLEEYVNKYNYIMPYDLGAKGSCQIGANLATNAGGLRFIRYGSLHGTVLGIEVVLADGTVLDLMSTMRKDNTGYDLKQLFIGSEGTLGIITKVAILCAMKCSSQIATFLALSTYDDVIKTFHLVRSELNEYLTTFEMMDSISLEAVTNNLNLMHPFGSNGNNFYVLFELSSNDVTNAETRLSQTLEKLISDNLITDGTYISDVNQQKFVQLKSYRERIAEALMRDGYTYKYDVSLPLEVYYKLVEIMRERLINTSSIRICGYGHIGDSNLHLNITSKQFDSNLFNLIEPFVYEYVAQHNGSISAEHGLGLKKRSYMHFSKKPEAIFLMKQIKNLFDPNHILNPGKMLPN